jgi:hypothetical protein
MFLRRRVSVFARWWPHAIAGIDCLAETRRPSL